MKLLLQVLLSLVIVSLSYFVPREDFLLSFSLFTVGFLSIFLLSKRTSSETELFYSGLFLRLLTIASLPLMSDDYYRFLWDGAMTLKGLNPLALTPEMFSELKDLNPYLQSLYQGMNSKSYFTVYPPLNQAIFYLANILSQGNVLVGVVFVRIVIIASEIFAFKGMIRLLKHLGLTLKWSHFYWMNPMIIMELTGNLHMESIMICGFIWTMVFLVQNKLVFSAFAMFLSVNGKLHTLMFLPLILSFLGFRKFVKFISIFSILIIFSVLPFLSKELILNLSQSLNLYFQSFEFNASIFYLLREVGYLLKGYNVIQAVGPILSLSALVFILFISFKSKVESLNDLLGRSMYVFLIFLLFSNTVHPWYVSLFLVLSLMNERYVGIVWTLLILLTYTAYSTSVYQENLWVVLIEYLLVLTLFFFEKPLFLKMNKTT